jgi:hypothetical protein
MPHPHQQLWDEVERRLRTLSRSLSERLSTDALERALEFLDHNELGLAAETLCDILQDKHIAITQTEFDELLSIIQRMGLPTDRPSSLRFQVRAHD